MAALNRGIPHYADGQPDVPLAAMSPDAALPASAAPVAPATPAAPASGFGQLLSGQFTAAAQNPESSPATSFLAGLADRYANFNRVSKLAAGPSATDWLGNLFAGNQASTNALNERAAVAQGFRQPTIQQHLIANPNEIAQAEQNPAQYVGQFGNALQQAVDVHKQAVSNPKATEDQHAPVVKMVLENPGLTTDAAHAGMNPHQYTRDEFIKATEGMTANHAQMLFGAALGHVATPQEKAATEYFDRLHGDFAAADYKLKQLMAEDAAAKPGATLNSYKPMFGTSKIDQAQAERARALKAIMEGAAAMGGITQKPFGQQ